MMVNGDPPGAAKDSQRGIDLSARVVAMKPDDPAAVKALARAYGVNSYQQTMRGDRAAAVDSADKAIATLESLHRARPDDPDVTADVFNAYTVGCRFFRAPRRVRRSSIATAIWRGKPGVR